MSDRRLQKPQGQAGRGVLLRGITLNYLGRDLAAVLISTVRFERCLVCLKHSAMVSAFRLPVPCSNKSVTWRVATSGLPSLERREGDPEADACLRGQWWNPEAASIRKEEKKYGALH